MSASNPTGKAGWLGWVLVRLNLLAFVAASLLAKGVMPERAADGTVRMVICTGNGPAQISAPLGNTDQDGPRDSRVPCAFALAQAAAALPEALPALAPPVSVARKIHSGVTTAEIAPRAPRPFQARAPPLFV